MISGEFNHSIPRDKTCLLLRRRRDLVGLIVCLVGVLTAVALAGCSTSALAPVSSRDSGALERASVSSPAKPSRPGYHEVAKGDTLYSIAWRYGLDHRSLAEWNDISEPYVIYPGQDIRLKPAPRRRQKPDPQTTPGSESEKAARTSPPSKSVTSQKKTKNTTTKHTINWQWPTPGKLVKVNTPIAKKGVNISGSQGQSVKAAADGRVVYSGSGLLGYGKLIIIKHSDVYLSAYAHNEKIYVKEGDRVVVGQKIATMGLGNNGEPVLHFEIRKEGKPVSPLYHLPENRS